MGWVLVAPLMAVGMAAALMIPIVLLLFLIKALKARQNPGQSIEETRMIQSMYQQLSKMEERVEALETILADHGKGGQAR